MSDTLSNLHQDHIQMAQICSLCEAELTSIENGTTPDFELLEDIMRYITDYPDTHHHPTEDIVFSQLKRRMPKAGHEIEAILAEHSEVLDAGIRFLNAIRALREDVVMDRKEFVDLGRNYHSMLNEHMNIEEGHLFPMAQESLTAEDWREIEDKIEHRPDPLFGAMVDIECRRLRQRIEPLLTGDTNNGEQTNP